MKTERSERFGTGHPLHASLRCWMAGGLVVFAAIGSLCDTVVRAESAQTRAPNLLWIVTDDHRSDSIQAYNRAVYGQDDSPLGHVESPNIDRLAGEGVLFTRVFCNAPVCAPSRGSMHTGRYPFRNGHYAFEITHQAPDFVRPTVSQTLRDHGYQTALFGKPGHYIFRWGPGQGYNDAGLFDTEVDFKHDLQKNGIGEIFTGVRFGKRQGRTQVIGTAEKVLYPDGRTKEYFISRVGEDLTPEDLAARREVDQQFDLLRSYTRSNPSLIIGGVNPKPAGKTIDAAVVDEYTRYLTNRDSEYLTAWGKSQRGVDTERPVFIHLSFHLPHTPVLPPKSFRDRFAQYSYKVPEFDKSDVERLPPQMQRMYQATKIDDLTPEEKQTAIQDYYAFCAYGDALIGDAVDKFKAYCESRDADYRILFTIGDHGWHLGEQGIEAKFTPWRQSVSDSVILVSSDKNAVVPGTVCDQLVEYVDFAPTLLASAGLDIHSERFDYLDGYSLFDVIDGKRPERQYAVGEINVIVGPRAYLHTDRFRFSMRTRPFDNLVNKNQLGQDLRWALDAPAEEVDLMLYDLAVDPLERRNVAGQSEYRELAEWFRQKLGRIVLGDGRAECDWSMENTFHISDFALGADDKKLDIPPEIIPEPAMAVSKR
ncbi:sulfatase-like hydrolase/transferase [Crateriforma conspicua]|uniref:sulfatase-like hydrolase/transferase n=1 Tax=Crateriforma conspicua TaxID=2527996 RepID=UPI00118AFDE4|nr:sulfatase-like hydrolase/transferase [Crateriforma conspicua]QDV63966.1 Choline-sulfatase [Crateriforma conspicua]